MTNSELFEMHKKLCDSALKLMQKKNHDYSGKSGKEPFANFTRAEAMGITTTEKGMLVRMLDKISRLSSFADSGEFKVEDEKLEDTIIDIINYSVLLYAYVQQKNTKNTGQMDLQYDIMELRVPHLFDEYINDIQARYGMDAPLYSKGSVVRGAEDPKRV
jgi:hypothetical protein